MRIVIAEDSGLLRRLLADLLTARGFDVICQASDPETVQRFVAGFPVEVVLLDIRMPPTFTDEGLRLAEHLRSTTPAVGLLVLSHYAETAYAVRLLQCADRAVGYLVKDRVHDPDRLVEAIHRVAAGEVVLDSEVVQRLMRRPRLADPLGRLTAAERQVLELMAEGRSNTAIAQKLHYSVKTVEKRVNAVVVKLGLPPIDDPARTDINLRVLAVLTYLRNLQLPLR
jgi:DNA-binding NarL/FixJ family response regulator